jgi:hypothetical protein
MLAHLQLISAGKLSGYTKRPDTLYRDFPRLRQAPAQSPTDGNSATIAAVMADAQNASKKALAAAQKKYRAHMKALSDLQRTGQLTPEQFNQRVAAAAHDTKANWEDALAASSRVIDAAKQDPAFVAAVKAAQQPRARPPIPAQPIAVELQKSWHCLNYIWTGEATLEESATSESPILGGRPIADQSEIMAYGPVRYFTAPKAYALSGLLAAFPWRQKIAEYDPVAARAFDIYAPDHASDELEYFSELLTAFYGHAARGGSGVLSWIE